MPLKILDVLGGGLLGGHLLGVANADHLLLSVTRKGEQQSDLAAPIVQVRMSRNGSN